MPEFRYGRIFQGNILRVVLLVSLVVLFFWAWFPAFDVGFLADDYEWFVLIRSLESAETWRLFWPQSLEPVRVMYRPLIGFLFWVDWRMWGLEPVGYHLTNLFFHATSIFGVFFLTRLLCELGKRQNGLIIGYLASGLFAVNPFLPEAVTWVDGRYDVVATAFFVWSLVFFVWSILSRSHSLKLLIFSLVLAFVSLLAKEIGLVYPLFVLLIYKYIDKSINRWYEAVIHFLKRRWMIILVASGVVIVYLLVSTTALGRPFWKVSGYSAAISRPFLLWSFLTVVWMAASSDRRFVVGIRWLIWLFIGFSLLPIAFLPTQLRFLYLPSAMASVWVAFVVFEMARHLKLERLLVPVWLFFVVLFSSFLRIENLEWMSVSRLQRQTVASIREHLASSGEALVYIFNLPDHSGAVPMFRTYTAEAVLLGNGGVSQLDEGVQVITGPKTIQIDSSSWDALDSKTVQVRSESGFVVFAPSVVERFFDGSVLVDWKGEWKATVSADRKEAIITLPRGLDEEGVLGLVFEDGEILRID